MTMRCARMLAVLLATGIGVARAEETVLIVNGKVVALDAFPAGARVDPAVADVTRWYEQARHGDRAAAEKLAAQLARGGLTGTGPFTAGKQAESDFLSDNDPALRRLAAGVVLASTGVPDNGTALPESVLQRLESNDSKLCTEGVVLSTALYLRGAIDRLTLDEILIRALRSPRMDASKVTACYGAIGDQAAALQLWQVFADENAPPAAREGARNVLAETGVFSKEERNGLICRFGAALTSPASRHETRAWSAQALRMLTKERIGDDPDDWLPLLSAECRGRAVFRPVVSTRRLNVITTRGGPLEIVEHRRPFRRR